MRPICVYPGSFDPPTYGHLRVVEKAAELFPSLTVVCSVNEGKPGRWFSPEEAKRLWRAYPLPAGVRVLTLADFLAAHPDPEAIVMVRGVRNEADAEAEKLVMLDNRARFGIARFLYLFDEAVRDVSSTRTRQAARNLDWDGIGRCVAPLAASALLEKTLGLTNLCLVVGPPGGGKSTFMRRLAALDPANVHVDTDRFLDELKPEIFRRFAGEDHCRVALDREAELLAFVAPLWLAKLRAAVAAAPAGANLFIEAAYALQADKELFRKVGGKIVYVDCGGKGENCRRIRGRGTPQHLPFVERIPGWERTREIAAEHRLLVERVDTSGGEAGLDRLAAEFHARLKGGMLWNACSWR